MEHKFKVWDLPTRLFHWTLVVAILFLWWSAEQSGDWMQWHIRVGLLVGSLIIFRIIWGFIGSDTARFSQFIKGPKTIRRYLRNEISENEQPGHNPLGAIMVVTLILCILFQVITGLFSPDENTYVYNGYLQKFISSDLGSILRKIHITFFWLICFFVTIHIFAVIAHKIIKKINLVIPMLTGYKYLTDPLPKLYFKTNTLAAIVFIIIIALVYCLTLI